MTPRFVFLPEAQTELQEANAWYEERAPGLELEFSRAVDAAIAAIGRFPEAFPLVEADMRRAVLRRFPYQLIYSKIRTASSSFPAGITGESLRAGAHVDDT